MAASTCGVLLTSRQIIRCMLNFDKPLVMLCFFKSGFGIALFASTEDFGGQILTFIIYISCQECWYNNYYQKGWGKHSSD